MRLCRIGPEGAPRAAFYFDTHVVPVAAAAVAHSQARGTSVRIPTKDDILPLLGDFALHETVTWLAKSTHPPGAIPMDQAELLVPIAKPNKIFCLAGNYAEHIKEGGGLPAERGADISVRVHEATEHNTHASKSPDPIAKGCARMRSIGNWSWPW